LACWPEFSVEFSAPPEISGGVMENNLSTGWAQTSDLQIMNQVFYHCSTAPLNLRRCNYIHSVPCWDFPTVSVVTRSRIYRLYLVVTCRDFPAISAVLAAKFSGRICSYLPGFSGLTFSGTRRPGFSGCICCFWPGFSGHSFSGMDNFKKTLWAAGKLFWYLQRDFLFLLWELSGGKLKQKGFFHM
jgi:hypothetical protein